MQIRTVKHWCELIIILLFFSATDSYAAIQKGDINKDSRVNLADAILALQVLSNRSTSANIYAESSITEDHKIGTQEAIYILQAVSDMRTLPPISSASVSDEYGYVTVDIYGQSVTFEFRDINTELPIEGLYVGFATGTNGLGALVTIDPAEKFPAQVILLQGEEPTTSASILRTTAAKRSPLSPPIFPLLLSKEPSSAISKYILSTLPKHVNKLGDVQDMISLVELGFHELNTAGLTHLGQPTGEILTQDEAMAEVKNDIKDSIKGQLFMFIATAGTPPGATGVMIDALTIGVKANTVMNCGLPGQQVSVRKLLWMRFYNCEQKTLTSMVDGLVKAAIAGEDQYGLPLDPTKSSLELINRDSLGDAYVGTFDNAGNLNLTVPVGDYRTNAKSPSYISKTFNTTLSQEGVTLNVEMNPVLPPECDWMACSNACYATYETCSASCDGIGDLIQRSNCVNSCTSQWLACPSNTDPDTCKCIL